MPRSAWLALDAATPPTPRARELRREWERFLEGEPILGVRAPVADSWRRSLAAGVDPSGRTPAPLLAERAEAGELWSAHPLAQAPLIREQLGPFAEATQHLIVVSDAKGMLLQLAGDPRVRSQAADMMNFTEGALWSEQEAGTNAVGTALAADHAVQVFASEHFVESVQAWTCAAAPVHDPETGELLAIVDLTGLREHVHPHSLALVVTAARSLEDLLRQHLHERDEGLRARYQGRIAGAGDRRALVSAAGRLVADDPRGWLRGTRHLELPAGGGELVLPSGVHVVAEPLGESEAYILHQVVSRAKAGREPRAHVEPIRAGRRRAHERPRSRFARGALLDRQGERRALDRLIAMARSGEGGAVVVRGERGIGKSALLRYAMEAALPTCRVLWAAGMESEAELAFAGLHQLCAGMLDRLDRLPGPQREALKAAFGLTPEAAPDPFFVALAVLGLLKDMAAEQPLLCVVDDMQWLDPASAHVLAIAARRVSAQPVAFVFAAREPGEELAGLPELPLHGLDDHDARALLESALVGPVDVRVLDRIVAETSGNPLALMEWSRGLPPAELAGGFVTPDAVAAPDAIEGDLRWRLEALPRDARRLLLVAAAESVGDPTHVWKAVAQLGLSRDAASAAAHTGLVEIGARVTFRHPLVRAAVYRSATPAELRAAHRALALAIDPEVDPDRRAWHLANSIAGPDEAVAIELERATARARERGGVAAAAAFLERAATLSADPAARPERALRAAEDKLQAGAPEAALGLLAMADAAPLSELQRARLERLRGQVAFASAHGGRDAPQLLLHAAQRMEALDARVGRETYLDALQAALVEGSHPRIFEIARAARGALPAKGPRTPADRLLEALALLFNEGHVAAAPALARVLDDSPSETWTRWPWFVAVISWELWDVDRYTEVSARQVAAARETGAVESLLAGLSMLAIAYVHSGDFTAAEGLVEESEAVAAAIGARHRPVARTVLAAWRGREPEAMTAIAAAVGDASERGEAVMLPFGELFTAVLRNGLGDYAAALTAAQRASEAVGVGFASRALPELVEAAVRCGENEVAVAALARLRDLINAPTTDWAVGIKAYATALVEPHRAEHEFRTALGHLARTGRSVYRARAHLLYGEWLRRERRRSEAREQLRTAYDLFAGMGAEAFATRAARELMVTGERVRKRSGDVRDELTPREAQIARLAAEGVPNLEIAARLYISHRTVEYHLTKIFAKLEIRSRSQLRDALTEYGAEEPVGVSSPGAP
jgi:DNA-binding CsgD family transcriptional regulator